MNKGTKDNKGFSLVELIVVILIMAILAVALTPQVIKWVNHSRIASDRSLMDTLISNCQTALTNQKAYNDVAADVTITVTNSGTEMSSDYSNLKDKIAEYSGYTSWGDFDDTKTEAANGVITITIHKDGMRVTGAYTGANNLADFEDEIATPAPATP